MGENIRIDSSFDYVPLIISLICVVIVAVVRNRYTKKYRTQIEGYFQPRYLDQIIREESNATQVPMLLMQTNGFLSIALTSYMAINEFANLDLASWGLFSLCFVVLVSIFTYHTILNAFTQFFLQGDFGLTEHRYHNIVVHQVAGIGLIPLNLMAAYARDWNKTFLLIALGLVAISLLYKYIYASFRGIQLKLSLVYIILYLCTLEILPLVAIFGVLVGEKVEIN